VRDSIGSSIAKLIEMRKINAPGAGVLCQCHAAVMPCRSSVRPMARDRGAHACSSVGSALPGRFATEVAANHAVLGRAKSSAGRAALRSGLASGVILLRQVPQFEPLTPKQGYGCIPRMRRTASEADIRRAACAAAAAKWPKRAKQR